MKRMTTLAGLAFLAAATTTHAQQGDPRRGEKTFEQCRACHAVEGKANEIGPTLAGVFGRKAADRDDFRYSPALKRSGITWSAQTLDGFITDPQKVVPGNRMPFSGLPDARERADLIAFMLQAFK